MNENEFTYKGKTYKAVPAYGDGDCSKEKDTPKRKKKTEIRNIVLLFPQKIFKSLIKSISSS
jgi:hypothetical protein